MFLPHVTIVCGCQRMYVTYTLFGMGEIGEREVEERDFEEKC